MNIYDRMRAHYWGRVYDTTSAGTETGTSTAPPRKNGKDTSIEDGDPPAGYFSREYVTELRAENKGYRLKASEQQRLREEAEARATKAAEDLAKAEQAAMSKAEQRIMKAELKAQAIGLGMIDLDGLTFLDYSKLKFDDKGELQGGAEALTALKEAKPHLFGGKVSTTSTSKAPASDGKTDPVDARKLSSDEWNALKAKHGLRR